MTREEQHPQYGTISGMIMALEIIAKYQEKGFAQTYFLSAAHDEIFARVTQTQMSPDSEDGKLMLSLGWHTNSFDGWSYFV